MPADLAPVSPDRARDHVAVGLIVADDGRLLLQLRDNRPGLEAAGKWGFFGGHLLPGERPSEAFLREMREELGWRPRHVEKYAVREVDDADWQVTAHAFAAHLDVETDALVLGEGQRLGLHDPAALPPDTADGARAVIAEFVASDVYRRVRRRYDVITSTGLLVDRAGRFLLQLRDEKPSIANPGKWGSFGGEVEPGEPPDEGFARELQEELGWAPARFELYGAYPYRTGEAWQLIYAYAALVDVPPEALTLGEGQDLGFFAPDALPAAVVPDLARLIAEFAQSETYARLRA